MIKMKEIRKCKQCGKEFTAKNSAQIYCSQPCRRKAKKRLYEARKQNGLCLYCGNPVETGRLCPKCNEKHKTWHRQAYQKRKAKEGTEKRTDETKQQNEWLCVHCGIPTKKGRLMCRKCQEIAMGVQQKKEEPKKRKTLADIVNDIERYNSEHGTRYSYGQYMAMKEMGKIV